MNIVTVFQHIKDLSRQAYIRQALLVSGGREWQRKQIADLVPVLANRALLCVSNDKSLACDCKPLTHFRQALGDEFDEVILDLCDELQPDILGAVAGSLRGGGVLVLLVPEFDQWPQVRDDFFPKSDWHEEKPARVFAQRFIDSLARTGVHILTPNGVQGTTPVLEKCSASIHEEVLQAQQAPIIEDILRVVHGHRRRPLVLTADRGRGKSACLGIAAARLIADGVAPVVITAPNRGAVHSVFKHAEQLGTDTQALRFIAVDELCHEEVDARVILVDEAGAIPVPLLKQLTRKYSRIVFSTTVHGYEGNGRGFALRFLSHLDQHCPGWKQTELSYPARWAELDPLESWLNSLLLLDAEAATPPEIAENSQIEFQTCSGKELARDETLLRSVFSLLVLAHYQTRPYDLRVLLDGPGVEIHIVKLGDAVLAAAITVCEGNIPQDMATAIQRGERRLHGEVLPQSLAQYLNLSRAVQWRYQRILRIAVHPEIQSRGIGSKLIDYVHRGARQQGLDYVGVNFGVESGLVRFWHRLGYRPLRLGVRKDNSSGEFSLLMLHPVSGSDDLTAYVSRFAQQMLVSLAEIYSSMSPGLIDVLLQACGSDEVMSLSQEDLIELVDFAYGRAGYETSLLSIHRFVSQVLIHKGLRNVLETEERELLICKVLQGKPWEALTVFTVQPGKANLVAQVKASVRSVVAQLPQAEGYIRNYTSSSM